MPIELPGTKATYWLSYVLEYFFSTIVATPPVQVIVAFMTPEMMGQSVALVRKIRVRAIKRVCIN